MSFKRTSRLFASAAVTAGLAFGGLALTAPAAQAATATATAQYTCATPLANTLPPPLNTLLGSFKVPATFSLDTLPTALTANIPVPAGLPLVGQLQFPTTQGGLAGILQSVAITLQSILGPTPLNAVSTQFSNGVATISGQLGAFTPTSGLPLPIPTSFDASLLTNNPLFSLLGIKCTLDPGSTVITNNGGTTGGGGTTTGLAKQNAKVKAKGKKAVAVGQRVLVKVKVKTAAGQKAAGQVTAKVGKRVITKALKSGKATFKFQGLKLGKRKITFSYSGDSSTNAAKKKFTVRVTR